MIDTPLTFAKAFARFKNILTEQPAGDLRLLVALEFWPTLAPKLSVPSYQSYFDEYLALVVPLVTRENLEDFTLDELENVQAVLSEVNGENNRPDILDCRIAVALKKAELYFWVGEAEKALAACSELPGVGDVTLSDGLISGKNEYEAFAAVRDSIVDTNPALYEMLTVIHDRWESVRDAFYHDRIACLFVEKDSSGKARRGRLKTLEGTVEYCSKSVPTDEITFDSQLKSPDDPFVGVVYDSMEAVRQVLTTMNFKAGTSSRYHAHFSLGHNGQAFTGDSIGLATGLITYCQLLKPEISRTERFISAEIACTGSVDADGRVNAVSEETLAMKVERAFFSPIKFVAVPQADLNSAQDCLKRFRKDYPRRRLQLIGIEHIRDAIENRNILRDEKVCIGEFVGRKAAKYGRSVKVQIPILLVLVYFLLALINTKTFAPWWFDWKIVRVVVDGNLLKTVNANEQTVWGPEDIGLKVEEEEYSDPILGKRYATLIDLDNDGRDELFFSPFNRTLPGRLQLWDKNGEKQWEVPTFVETSWPISMEDYKGIEGRLGYSNAKIQLITDSAGNKFVLTSTYADSPGRVQFLLFDIFGNCIGEPYLLTGTFDFYYKLTLYTDINNDGNKELVLGCVNNRYNGAGILVLDPFDLYGVCPPYEGARYKLSNMKKGSQLYYVDFPETPLSAREGRNTIKLFNYDEGNKTLKVEVLEGAQVPVKGKFLSMEERPEVIYYLDSNFIPISCNFGDGCGRLLNQHLKALGRPEVADFKQLEDSMFEEVIVYKRDSIVHHKAAGIDFYEE